MENEYLVYEKLCDDVKRISDSFGLESEIFPMKRYYYSDGPNSKGYYEEIRLLFHGKQACNSRHFMYSISALNWELLVSRDCAYDCFIKELSRRVREELVEVKHEHLSNK